MTETESETVTATTAQFYRDALETLTSSGVPFLLAGAYALAAYTDITRNTKDLDVFCTPGDYPRLLAALALRGYQTEVTDANWIAKAFQGDNYVDLIFHSANGVVKVDDAWFQRAPERTVFDTKVRLLPVTELVWSKLYIEDRYRYDGADVNHLILRSGTEIDWHRLLGYMDRDWKLLYSHVMNFQFVYPGERDTIPRWLLDEFGHRLQVEYTLPASSDPICRGPMLSRTQYRIDIDKWGYKTT